ncbi:MAG: putative endopeptidase [Nocardioidaceae bacterium]|nr:putative endopeptidase [Nocardioidaceae bacterium]
MTILDDAQAGMDETVRPQDDLFGHVNGRWLETVEIPSDKAVWGAFPALAERAEKEAAAIIEECAAASADAPAGSPVQQIGDLWKSFMDEDRIEALGADPVRADLEVLAAVEDLDGLVRFVGAMERRGMGGFFGAYVDTDDRDSDRYLAKIVQGGIGLPDETYYREEKFAEIREAYVAYLTHMFELTGHPSAATAAGQVMRVETCIAEGHWERAETRDVLKGYNLKTLGDLDSLAPSFPWRSWVEAIGGTEETLAESIVRQP